MGPADAAVYACCMLPGLAHAGLVRRAGIGRFGADGPAFRMNLLGYDDLAYLGGLSPIEVRFHEFLMTAAWYGFGAMLGYAILFGHEGEPPLFGHDVSAVMAALLAYISHLVVRLKVADKRERFGPLLEAG